MRPGRIAVVLARAAVIVGPALALCGCFGIPDIQAAGDPLGGPGASPERSAAVAEMRAEAAEGDHMRYPPVFQEDQVTRLAARSEPMSTAEADSLKAELEAISTARQATTDTTQIALLDAREEELRRLLQRAPTEELRK